MVRLLDQCVLGGKPPGKAKGGMKRSHPLQYVIQAQYGLGSKYLGCRGSAEDEGEKRVSGREHWGLNAGLIPLETPLAVLLPLVYPPGSPWVLEAVRPA